MNTSSSSPKGGRTPTSRVDKLLGSMGYGSRAEMARLGKAGGIVLDGVDLTDVSKRIPVTPDLPTRMEIDGEPLDPVAGLVMLLNKPLGMTCSRKEDGALVYDILPDRWKRRDPAISTIGRLDKQTSGLLLLTDDGDLLHRVISPKRHVAKVYRATLARPLTGTEGRCSPRAIWCWRARTSRWRPPSSRWCRRPRPF